MRNLDEMEVGPYRTEYAVGVWAQLRGLGRSDLDQFDRELQALAQKHWRSTAESDAGDPATCRLLAILNGWQVTYELNASRRVLTVLHARRESDSGS